MALARARAGYHDGTVQYMYGVLAGRPGRKKKKKKKTRKRKKKKLLGVGWVGDTPKDKGKEKRKKKKKRKTSGWWWDGMGGRGAPTLFSRARARGGKAPGRRGAAPSPHPPWAVGSATRARSARARDPGYGAGRGLRVRAPGEKKTEIFKVQTACRVRIKRTNACECALGARGDGVEVLTLEVFFFTVFFSLASVGWVGRSVGAAFFFFGARADKKKGASRYALRTSKRTRI